MLNTFVIL